MFKYILIALIIYFIVISVISVRYTLKDKDAARKRRLRVPESKLMFLGLIGGAGSMYITMKIIRHKTKHLKFMLGLPAEIIFHLALIVAIFILTK